MNLLFERILGIFSLDMGIDLGTANTAVCVGGQGIVLCEPSVVAVRKGTTEVLNGGNAVGNEAKDMLDKCPGNIEAIRPLKNGVISDFEITEAMLAYFIRKVHKRAWGLKPRLIISVPMGITSVEKRAVIESAERAGARSVFLIEQPKAAALGAGLPISDPQGSMIVDIGGGTTDIACLSLQGVVTYETLRVAGDEFTQAITSYIKEHCGLLIGEQTSEKIKIAIGSAVPMELIGGEEMQMEIRGRNMATSLPGRTMINSLQVREAITPVLKQIAASIKHTLERTPPEIAADLVDRGITLAGGGANLRGLDFYLEHEVNLPVKRADEPIYAVCRGTEAVLNDINRFGELLESAEDI
ncbi:MAG: Rod shape-determining protein MreB [Planctomycetes bacterium]|nr:Rod shape-determining protein MreB [Planctomycetota bacterium]MCQ3949354.1 rod shape-determining protein [Planctomycetota bacterium]GIK53579.1 MAG: rod shape-determining protein [Planctomycetota bacterium]HRJ80019.1 rod shape-determining protein [Planctomycetota bacterium]